MEDDDDDSLEDVDELDNSEYTTVQIDDTGVEMQLPNGVKLGHRKMARYYKQSLVKENRVPSEGEQTISLVYPQTPVVEAWREKARLQGLKEKGTTEVKNRSRDIALSLKKGNNLEHYRNATY
ncbi:unnamed protein product [Ambrosiozyma monospora]|uniref:Unnamed protein product n=1 Tax=Ambrosiozyma monospora TaxID=43982 RepID=A0ACB5TQG8_AMBMO|nr:unnamed protein product [Ambrosiozyma monospora]